MAFATRTTKHWHDARNVERELVNQLEEAKARMDLDCAQIRPMKPHSIGNTVTVSVLIDCSKCENPTSAEVALLLDVV